MADTTEPRPEFGVIGLLLQGQPVELLGPVDGAEAAEAVGDGGDVGGRDHQRRPARGLLCSVVTQTPNRTTAAC
jgi:hypothetical protein